jgi:hypothetical protein
MQAVIESLPRARAGHVLENRAHVTKGMCRLVPSSSIGSENPYTITVTGPEFCLRRTQGKTGLHGAVN